MVEEAGLQRVAVSPLVADMDMVVAATTVAA